MIGIGKYNSKLGAIAEYIKWVFFRNVSKHKLLCWYQLPIFMVGNETTFKR